MNKGIKLILMGHILIRTYNNLNIEVKSVLTIKLLNRSSNIDGTKTQYVIKTTFLRVGLKHHNFILYHYHNFS